MPLIILALIAALCLACAGTQPTVITQIPKTVGEACDFYRNTKPMVVAYVQYRSANWETTPEVEKALLLQLRDQLPMLDELGQDVCAISDALSAIEEGRQIVTGGNVDWDSVLSTVLKVASTAAQLKAQGAF